MAQQSHCLLIYWDLLREHHLLCGHTWFQTAQLAHVAHSWKWCLCRACGSDSARLFMVESGPFAGRSKVKGLKQIIHSVLNASLWECHGLTCVNRRFCNWKSRAQTLIIAPWSGTQGGQLQIGLYCTQVVCQDSSAIDLPCFLYDLVIYSNSTVAFDNTFTGYVLYQFWK